MSEIDPNLIGRGSSMGKNRGLSVQEIDKLFVACRAEPSMRSINAVLRITREQIEARGQLGPYGPLTIAAGVITAILLVLTWRFPALMILRQEGDRRPAAAAGGSALITLFLAYGAMTSHKERRANVAQEREIRRIAALALDDILQHNFPPRPLQREPLTTLRDLIKQHPELTSLAELVAEQ